MTYQPLMLSIDEYRKERVEIGCCVPFFHLRFLLSFPPLLRLSGRSKVNPRAETESNYKVTHKPFPGLRRHGGEPIFFTTKKAGPLSSRRTSTGSWKLLLICKSLSWKMNRISFIRRLSHSVNQNLC